MTFNQSEYNKKYRQEHKKILLEYNRKYYRDNRKVLLEYNKKYRQSEYGSKLRRIIEQRKGVRARQCRKDLIMVLGGYCIKCGFDDIRALDLEHKNGGGRKERRHMGGNNFYVYYFTHQDEAREKLQVFCSNCNRIKHSIIANEKEVFN